MATLNRIKINYQLDHPPRATPTSLSSHIVNGKGENMRITQSGQSFSLDTLIRDILNQLKLTKPDFEKQISDAASHIDKIPESITLDSFQITKRLSKNQTFSIEDEVKNSYTISFNQEDHIFKLENSALELSYSKNNEIRLEMRHKNINIISRKEIVDLLKPAFQALLAITHLAVDRAGKTTSNTNSPSYPQSSMSNSSNLGSLYDRDLTKNPTEESSLVPKSSFTSLFSSNLSVKKVIGIALGIIGSLALGTFVYYQHNPTLLNPRIVDFLNKFSFNSGKILR